MDGSWRWLKLTNLRDLTPSVDAAADTGERKCVQRAAGFDQCRMRLPFRADLDGKGMAAGPAADDRAAGKLHACGQRLLRAARHVDPCAAAVAAAQDAAAHAPDQYGTVAQH